MLLIFNALEDGWKIQKKNDKYYFKKNHDNDKKYFSDDILNEFLEKYLNMDL